MYSIELNGSFIRQGSNRQSMLSSFRRKLGELDAAADVLRLWWNGMVIMASDNMIYNCEIDEI